MTICVTIASVEHGGWIRKIKQVRKKFKFVLTCLLIVLLLAPRGFSPNTPVSLSSSALSKFQFDLKRTNTSVPRSYELLRRCEGMNQYISILYKLQDKRRLVMEETDRVNNDQLEIFVFYVAVASLFFSMADFSKFTISVFSKISAFCSAVRP